MSNCYWTSRSHLHDNDWAQWPNFPYRIVVSVLGNNFIKVKGKGGAGRGSEHSQPYEIRSISYFIAMAKLSEQYLLYTHLHDVRKLQIVLSKNQTEYFFASLSTLPEGKILHQNWWETKFDQRSQKGDFGLRRQLPTTTTQSRLSPFISCFQVWLISWYILAVQLSKMSK